MTFEELRQEIYRIKMEIAYNKNYNVILEKLDREVESYLTDVNYELGTGLYRQELYEELWGYKTDLIQLNRKIYAQRVVNKYGKEWLKERDIDLYECL